MTAAGGHEGIVVDVGGTTTRVARHRDGRLAGDVRRFDTPSPRTDPRRPVAALREELFDRIATEVRRLRAAVPGSADELGVSWGAVVDTAGVVRDASVLWLEPSTGFDVTAALRRRLPWARPVVLNDVAAAAWHFRHLGRFALVTVSTGVAVKVFDAAAPVDQRVLVGPDGLGGESGHTVVEPAAVDALPDGLGAAAAGGDPGARAELERRGLPWCECGAVADLCAYASGPAVARAAAALARREPARFAASALAAPTGGDPDRVDPAAIAACGGDPFLTEVLRWSTRALAARLLQLCADLGLATVVVTGGFAHGVGDPWFAALDHHLSRLLVGAGWFAGWGDARRAALIHRPDGAGEASLAGMAAYLAARGTRVREAVKPVGEARLVLREAPAPRCGREQLVLRLRYAGLCGTDLQVLRGERGCEPGVPGHECVATVAEVGADLGPGAGPGADRAGPRPGQLVTLNPNNPLDDHDKLGHNRPGVFAETLVLDAAFWHRGQVVPLPGPAAPELVLVEPLAAVVRCLEMAAEVAPGRRVLVAGGGVSGLLLLLLARRRGARVLLASRAAASRDRAVALGLCDRGDAFPLDPALAAAVRRATAGAGVDTAVIAVGGGAGPATAGLLWPALADGAALQLFGGFAPADHLPLAGPDPLGPVGPVRAAAGSVRLRAPTGRRVVVMGNRGGRNADLHAAARLCDPADQPPLGLDRLVSHLVSMAALPAVAAELAGTGTVRGEPALRVVVDPGLAGDVVRAARPTGDVVRVPGPVAAESSG